MTTLAATNAIDKTHDFAAHVAADIVALQQQDARQAQLLITFRRELDAVLVAASSAAAPVTTVSNTVVTRTAVNTTVLMGMDDSTGKLISGLAYLRQRLRNALGTPKGSQVLCRTRGFDALGFIDQPMNSVGVARLIAAIASAITHDQAGLPDFTLSRVVLSPQSEAMEGQFFCQISGAWAGVAVEVSL